MAIVAMTDGMVMRGSSDFCVCESVKTFYFADRGGTSSYTCRSAGFLSLEVGTHSCSYAELGFLPVGKVGTSKVLLLGFRRNPNRNRNPSRFLSPQNRN